MRWIRPQRSMWLATLVILVAAAATAEASPESDRRVRDALRDAYNLRFTECYRALDEAAAMDPRAPGTPRAFAAVVWVETLFAQGIATYEAFTGEMSGDDVVRPVVPAALRDRFRTHLVEAQQLADERVSRVGDADAYYQVGATAALSALYKATIEGRVFGAFGDGRKAVRAAQRAREFDPRRPEPAVILAMYRYVVSTLSLPMRLLAGVAGMSGSRDDALKLLHEASTPGSVSEADALVLMMVIYNREGRRQNALDVLARLQTQFPENRLFALNIAATAIEAHQPLRAERELSSRLEAHDSWQAPGIEGEYALWLLKRGTARAALNNDMRPADDLRRVLEESPRDWVRGRAHLELAKLSLGEGNNSDARGDLLHAVDIASRAGDGVAEREAKRLLKVLRR